MSTPKVVELTLSNGEKVQLLRWTTEGVTLEEARMWASAAPERVLSLEDVAAAPSFFAALAELGRNWCWLMLARDLLSDGPVLTKKVGGKPAEEVVWRAADHTSPYINTYWVLVA